MWYPDNDGRANRLNQLINSLNLKQAGITNDQSRIDVLNASIKPSLATALKLQGYADAKALVAHNKQLLTDDQKKQYDTLLIAANKISTGFDWNSFAGSLMVLPLDIAATATFVMGVATFTVRTATVKAFSDFLNKVGSDTTQEDADVLIEISDDTTGTIKESLDWGGDLAADIGELIAEASIVAGQMAKMLELIGALGFIASLIIEPIEIADEANQKKKLVNAIHEVQPARLSAAFYETEAIYVLEQIQLSQTLLVALANPTRPNSAAGAEYLGGGMLDQMTSTGTTADWNDLEATLEKQDKTSTLFYGHDDLPSAQVVSLAKREKSD